jgi:hypothetical protein
MDGISLLNAQNWQSALEKSCSLEHDPQIILCAWIPKWLAGQPDSS